MAWFLIDGRDRGLIVAGATAGHPEYTRDPLRALRFERQDDARAWLDRNLVGVFGSVVLTRDPEPANATQNRVGKAGHYRKRA